MKLWLMRHGEAVPAYEDPRRPLSEHGRSQVLAAGKLARGSLPGDLAVLHSPKLRAEETARLFCQEAIPRARPRVSQGLLPGDPVELWVARVEEAGEDLMLVGHNPFLGDLASQLVRRPVGFATAGLVALERLDDGHWELIELT